jgi:hypothetical protein
MARASSTIEKAVAAAVVPQGDPEALLARRAVLEERHGELLGVETELKNRLAKEMSELLRQAETIRGAHRGRSGKEPLQVLDQDVLSWRNDVRIHGIVVPKLALLSTHAGTTSISGGTHAPVLPERLAWWYKDVRNGLNDASKRRFPKVRRHQATIAFAYKGAIPNDARQLIKDEAKNFDSIYLLAESPTEHWTYTDVIETAADRMRKALKNVHLDPLILGWRNNTLYLLGKFDPTPIETYVSEEFAHKALPVVSGVGR